MTRSRERSSNKATVARSDGNPIFLNEFAKNAINGEAKKWNAECRKRGIDDGKVFEDYAGDLYIMWCECCLKHKDKPEAYIMTDFMRNSKWALDKSIRDYFNHLEGLPEKGPEPFNPDFYKFTELYRSGMTLRDLATHYQVSSKTIQRYIKYNFVTKIPINPLEYLAQHEKLHGKDEMFKSLSLEILPNIELN